MKTPRHPRTFTGFILLELTCILCGIALHANALRNAAPAFPFSDIDHGGAFTFSVLTQDATLPTSVEFFPSAFTGTALPPSTRSDFTIDVNVMLPHILDDTQGCSGDWRNVTESGTSLRGAFVLLLASSACQQRASLAAAASGAAGIIVQGCSPDAPTYCNLRIQNDYTFVMVPVPILLTTYAEGQQLRSFLQAKRTLAANSNAMLPSNTLQIQLISTGPIVPEERAALISLMTVSTMSFFQAYTPEPLKYWTLERFQNISLDPCIDRVKGIWCEGGHVVIALVNFHAWVSHDGTIPTQFGQLTHLRYLNIDTNKFAGSVPVEWCGMTDLRVLQIGSQISTGITSLPNCAWTKLTAIHFEANSISELPALFTQFTLLKNIYGNSNRLTSLPSFATLTALEIIDLSQNFISGTFPSFSPLAPLNTISAGNNRFTTLASHTFDGMVKLKILDLNTAGIHALLPTLANCTAIVTLDLSSQRNLTDSASIGFYGPMPTTWRDMNQLETLLLQENSITSPVCSGAMARVRTIDLESNQLTRATANDQSNQDFDTWFNTALSSSTVSFRIGHNPGLGGPMGISTALLSHLQLTSLFMDACGFTTLFDELFVGSLITLDVSNNNITQTHLSSVGAGSAPSAVFQSLILTGNPGLVVQPLPSWITVLSAQTQLPGDLYACASLQATTSPLLKLAVDPQFFAFQYCDCIPGTFGHAPLCAYIPNQSVLKPYQPIASAEVGANFAELVQQAGGLTSQLTTNSSGVNLTSSSQQQKNFPTAFSDTQFGEKNRLVQGLSTSWVVDLSDLYTDRMDDGYTASDLTDIQQLNVRQLNATTFVPSGLTPVHVIYIQIYISAIEFNDFNDVLSLYSGGPDLKGQRVYFRRGTDVLPLTTSSAVTSTPTYILQHSASISKLQDPRLIEVQIFASTATVLFDTRKSSGRNFYGTYCYQFACPIDYFYDTTLDIPQCRPNYPLFTIDESIRSAVYAISTIGIVVVALNIVILLVKWNSLVFKAGSRMFLLLLLVLLELMAFGALLYAAIPTITNDAASRAVCHGRAWLTCFSLTGILSILLAKNMRLNSIFNARTLKVNIHTDVDTLKTVIGVMIIQVSLLAVFSGMPLSRPQLKLGSGSQSQYLVTSCSQEMGFYGWIGAEIFLVVLLVILTGYLGFRTRNLPSQYNESNHIQNAVVLLTFFGAILVPLDIFVAQDPNAAVILQGLGQALLCLLLTLILFGPKLYHLTQYGDVKNGVGPGVGGTTANTALGTSSLSTNTPIKSAAATAILQTPRVTETAAAATTPSNTHRRSTSTSAGKKRVTLARLSVAYPTAPKSSQPSINTEQGATLPSSPVEVAADPSAIQFHLQQPAALTDQSSHS